MLARNSKLNPLDLYTQVKVCIHKPLAHTISLSCSRLTVPAFHFQHLPTPRHLNSTVLRRYRPLASRATRPTSRAGISRPLHQHFLSLQNVTLIPHPRSAPRAARGAQPTVSHLPAAGRRKHAVQWGFSPAGVGPASVLTRLRGRHGIGASQRRPKMQHPKLACGTGLGARSRTSGRADAAWPAPAPVLSAPSAATVAALLYVPSKYTFKFPGAIHGRRTHPSSSSLVPRTRSLPLATPGPQSTVSHRSAAGRYKHATRRGAPPAGVGPAPVSTGCGPDDTFLLNGAGRHGIGDWTRSVVHCMNMHARNAAAQARLRPETRRAE